jgi:hypothetical protein
VNIQDAAKNLAESVDEFILSTVDELAGKQSAAEAVATARAALHRVVDVAVDSQMENVKVFEALVRLAQTTEGETL